MSGVSIPAAKALLVFAGLESPLSIAHWHLPTALGAAWTRRVTHLGQGHMSFACVAFSLLVLCSVQVIIEERKIQSDGGEKDKDNPTTKNNRQPQPKGRVSTIL